MYEKYGDIDVIFDIYIDNKEYEIANLIVSFAQNEIKIKLTDFHG